MDRATQITEMRDVLSFLEDNPKIPMPYFGMINSFANTDDGDDVNDLARIMAPCRKDASQGYFALIRSFGSTTLEINFEREEVCERIVMGTEDVPEKTTAAHTREIVEWRCPDGILRPA